MSTLGLVEPSSGKWVLGAWQRQFNMAGGAGLVLRHEEGRRPVLATRSPGNRATPVPASKAVAEGAVIELY